MVKGIVFSVFFALSAVKVHAQNRHFAQKTIDTLASSFYSGRGYIHQGDLLAANFIKESYTSIGLQPFKTNKYFYPFSFTVNTFPKTCKVMLNGKRLIPGVDFIVDPACPSVNKSFKIYTNASNQRHKNLKKMALVFDTSHKITKTEQELAHQTGLSIHLQKKLTWSVSTHQELQPHIDILKTSFPLEANTLTLKIKSKLVDHTANNVLGYIEGSSVKDTFIVLTAHYDHLGRMGKTMFPGANDNASGVAMMLDLAQYFKLNPCKYSIAFIAFAGEEPGLIGSKKYSDNPWDELPLHKMKFLINLDLMGSGEQGMAVVNATVFPEYFAKLQQANGLTEKKYLPAFKPRGKAANSDHYWFVERGVKGFFFYLMGAYNHYHDINDSRNNLRLGIYYDKTFLLIRDFILLI